MVQGVVSAHVSVPAPVVHTRHKKIRLDPATELLASSRNPMPCCHAAMPCRAKIPWPPGPTRPGFRWRWATFLARKRGSVALWSCWSCTMLHHVAPCCMLLQPGTPQSHQRAPQCVHFRSICDKSSQNAQRQPESLARLARLARLQRCCDVSLHGLGHHKVACIVRTHIDDGFFGPWSHSRAVAELSQSWKREHHEASWANSQHIKLCHWILSWNVLDILRSSSLVWKLSLVTQDLSTWSPDGNKCYTNKYLQHCRTSKSADQENKGKSNLACDCGFLSDVLF